MGKLMDLVRIAGKLHLSRILTIFLEWLKSCSSDFTRKLDSLILIFKRNSTKIAEKLKDQSSTDLKVTLT
jgi:hypothetical protein